MKYKIGDRFKNNGDIYPDIEIIDINKNAVFPYWTRDDAENEEWLKDEILDNEYTKIEDTKMKYKIGDRFKCVLVSYPDIEIIEIQDGEFPYVLTDGFISNDYKLDKRFTKIEESEQVAGDHYSKLKIDPYEYSMENNLNPLQMNAIKYITRYKDKNGIEDLKKALHTINRLIDYEQRTKV